MILTGEKKLIPLKELKQVEAGHFPEVSVKGLYEEFSQRAALQPYMPPKLGKGKQLDKRYFFNVVNTLYEEELQSILQHANAQRNSVEEQAQ